MNASLLGPLLLLIAEDKIVEFTSEVIRNFFVDEHYIFYLGQDHVNIKKAVFVSNKSITLYNHSNSLDSCDGYIMYIKCTNDFVHLIRNNFTLLPHRKVIVFTEEPYQKVDYNIIGNEVIFIGSYSLYGRINISLFDQHGRLVTWKARVKRSAKYSFQGNWRLTFKNSSFRVSAFNVPPYVNMRNRTITGGVEGHILLHITKNWPVELVAMPDYSWVEGRNTIKNKSCDLTLGSHNKAYVNFELCDATTAYTMAGYTLLVPKPQLLPKVLFIFQPLIIGLWLIIFASSLIIAEIYFCVRKKLHSTREGRYLHILADIIGAIFQNSNTHLSQDKTLYPTFLLVNILSILTGAYYSAGFTMNLTYPKFSKPINNFKDILENSLHFNDKNIRLTLNSSRAPFASEIANTPGLYSPDAKNEIFSATVISQYVFPQGKIPDDLKGTLKVMKEDVEKFEFVMILQKNSPYKKYFDLKIGMFLEHGLIDAWFRSTMYEDIKALQNMAQYWSYYTNVNSKCESLEMLRLQGLFYILFLGHFLALGVFLLEIT